MKAMGFRAGLGAAIWFFGCTPGLQAQDKPKALPLPSFLQQIRAGHQWVQNRLRAARKWQKVVGQGVVVYYPPDKRHSPSQAQQIAADCDWALKSAGHVLQTPALPVKVEVFVFYSAAAPGKALGMPEFSGADLAVEHSVVLLDTPEYAEQRKSMLVHEMAHIVVRQQLAVWIGAFFDEGLAVYTQNMVPETAFVSLGKAPPQIATETPLHDLVALTDSPYNYEHSGAFLTYLIKRDKGDLHRVKGMLKELDAQRVAWARSHKAWGGAEAVEAAVQKTYGASLAELETNWRAAERTGAN